MINNFPKILFFINSSNPTQKELADSFRLGPNVCFRNATLISENEAFESCDGVAGAIPKRYVEATVIKDNKTCRRFPDAQDALDAFSRKMEAEARLVEEKANAVDNKQKEAPKGKAKAKETAEASNPDADKPLPSWTPNA